MQVGVIIHTSTKICWHVACFKWANISVTHSVCNRGHLHREYKSILSISFQKMDKLLSGTSFWLFYFYAEAGAKSGLTRALAEICVATRLTNFVQAPETGL